MHEHEHDKSCVICEQMSESLLSPQAAEALKKVDDAPKRLWSRQSVRLQIVFLLCAALTVSGLNRGSMSLAMVCIVEPLANLTDATGLLPFESGNLNNANISKQELDDSLDKSIPTEKPQYRSQYQVKWTPEEQANVHTSFYIGSFIAIIVTDFVNRWLDQKTSMSLCLLLCALFSLLTPVAIIFTHSYIIVAIIRFFIGFACGFMLPCTLFIVSKWFPANEKSTAVGISTMGNQIGVGVSMIVTAELCELPILAGWPSSFVLYGLIGFIGLSIWAYRGSSRPRSSKVITATELEYITGKSLAKSRAVSVIMKTPWKKILINRCVFACCISSFAQSFVMSGLTAYLPKFNQEALKMDITQNGFWSSVPFFVQIATKILFSLGADALKTRGVSITITTWIFNGIATFGTAAFIFVAPILGHDYPMLAMSCVVIAFGLLGGFIPGYTTSSVMVAPQFTATISSYQQLYGQGASAIAPLFIGYFTSQGTLGEWRFVYLVLSIILVTAGVIFQIWGHGRAEPWGLPPSERNSRSNLHLTESGSAGKLNSRTHLESINAELLAVPLPEPRIPRVSYRDQVELHIPSTIDELDNDVIHDEEETNH